MKKGFAYYNDNDPFVVEWLRVLIDRRAICPGVVDRRSIREVVPSDLKGFTQHHFFAGIGGWSYALRLSGWSDSQEVWTGSCPCQPFSKAGRGGGFKDERHLWPAFYELIRKCKPAIVFGEQVASPAGLNWFDVVSNDLEDESYAVAAADICAAGVGAPHIRQRLYWTARRLVNPNCARLEGRRHAEGKRRNQRTAWAASDFVRCRDGKERPVESGTFPLAHGVPARVGRLRGYGNAIVPQQAAAFIKACVAARV